MPHDDEFIYTIEPWEALTTLFTILHAMRTFIFNRRWTSPGGQSTGLIETPTFTSVVRVPEIKDRGEMEWVIFQHET